MSPQLTTAIEKIQREPFGFQVRVRNESNGRERCHCTGSFAVGWDTALREVLDLELLGLHVVRPQRGDRIVLDIDCITTGRSGRFVIASYEPAAKWSPAD